MEVVRCEFVPAREPGPGCGGRGGVGLIGWIDVLVLDLDFVIVAVTGFFVGDPG